MAADGQQVDLQLLAVREPDSERKSTGTERRDGQDLVRGCIDPSFAEQRLSAVVLSRMARSRLASRT